MGTLFIGSGETGSEHWDLKITQIFDHASLLERYQTIVASAGVRLSTAVGEFTTKLRQSAKENKWHSNDKRNVVQYVNADKTCNEVVEHVGSFNCKVCGA